MAPRHAFVAFGIMAASFAQTITSPPVVTITAGADPRCTPFFSCCLQTASMEYCGVVAESCFANAPLTFSTATALTISTCSPQEPCYSSSVECYVGGFTVNGANPTSCASSYSACKAGSASTTTQTTASRTSITTSERTTSAAVIYTEHASSSPSATVNDLVSSATLVVITPKLSKSDKSDGSVTNFASHSAAAQPARSSTSPSGTTPSPTATASYTGAALAIGEKLAPAAAIVAAAAAFFV